MTGNSRKPTITRRFTKWILSLIVGFVVRRVTKHMGVSSPRKTSKKSSRKYVENKADK